MKCCYGRSEVGSTKVNGDRYYISEDESTLLLVDGASGAGVDGKVWMANTCVEVVLGFPFVSSNLSASAYIEVLLQKINRALIDLSQKYQRYLFGAVVVAVVDQEELFIASVGDCSAYLISNQQVSKIAQTKKRYESLIQAGIYTKEELETFVHQLPDCMWSMFDTFIPSVVLDVTIEKYHLGPQDSLILCTDGMSDYLKEEELTLDLDTIFQLAKERSSKENGRYDDLTFVCYRNESEN